MNIVQIILGHIQELKINKMNINKIIENENKRVNKKDLYEKHGLDSTGDKIINEYRVTSWGKVLRKYWIDELPMIINWLKRELKFVGVRPLSEDYFSRKYFISKIVKDYENSYFWIFWIYR